MVSRRFANVPMGTVSPAAGALVIPTLGCICLSVVLTLELRHDAEQQWITLDFRRDDNSASRLYYNHCILQRETRVETSVSPRKQ